jgi:hypothetical protein
LDWCYKSSESIGRLSSRLEPLASSPLSLYLFHLVSRSFAPKFSSHRPIRPLWFVCHPEIAITPRFHSPSPPPTRVSLSNASLLVMARLSPRREASPISPTDQSQRLLIFLQILSGSITSELSLMAQNSIRAGIGTRLVFGDTRSYSDHVHSGEPFITAIGVGKVIKGWDEGELLSIGFINPCCDTALTPMCSTHTGVPQLSLGEKAILTASPDYVSRELDLVCHTPGGLSVFSPNRRMVLADSRRSFQPTPPSSSKSNCSVSTRLESNLKFRGGDKAVNR